MTFRELGLKENILLAIEGLGFEMPTPIQEQAIPMMLATDSDFVGLAQTGTGKTAAYGLPLVQKMIFADPIVQGLVICPTRELCLQVAKDIESFSTSFTQASVVAVYGGVDINRQISKIQKGAHIIVATPGRLVDIIKRKKVKLNQVSVTVLDEADEMLNMGFKEDIDFILSKTPNQKSVWLFSATMPKEVERIAKNYMQDPKRVVVGKQNQGGQNIAHQYFQVKERDRYVAMKRYIDLHPDIFGLVFCRTRRDTQKVADQLMKDGYSAGPLHGDMSQAQRDQVMQQFRNRSIKMLVATDVAARGIDVDDVTHVIHYMLPDETENYTHRSGRTGRAGRNGISLAILNTREGRKIKDIEKISGAKFEKIEVPSPEDVCGSQLNHIIKKLVDVEVKEKEIAPYLIEVIRQFDHLSKEEFLERWLTLEMNQLLSYYKNAGDINAKDDSSKSSGKKSKRKGSSNLDGASDTLFIALGKKDGLNAGGVVRALCDQAGIQSNQIGRIDIKNNFTFVDVNEGIGPSVVQSVGELSFEGNKGSIEMKAGGGKSKGRGRSGGGRGKGRSGGGRSGGGKSHRGKSGRKYQKKY